MKLDDVRISRLAFDLENLIPSHEFTFVIEHNWHKCGNESAKDHIEFQERHGYHGYHGEPYEFCSDEDRQKAIDTNELWEARISNNVLYGNCAIAASSLEVMLKGLGRLEIMFEEEAKRLAEEATTAAGRDQGKPTDRSST